MKKTIHVWRFERGNQGCLYDYGTIERDVRQTTLRSAWNGCATGPIAEQKVPFVFLGRARFRVEPRDGQDAITLTSDFEIPKSVDRLISKVPKVLK